MTAINRYRLKRANSSRARLKITPASTAGLSQPLNRRRFLRDRVRRVVLGVKLVVGILSLVVAVAFLVWSILEFVPTCAQYGAVSDERACSGQPSLGVLLTLVSVTLAAAALRILSTDHRPAP